MVCTVALCHSLADKDAKFGWLGIHWMIEDCEDQADAVDLQFLDGLVEF